MKQRNFIENYVVGLIFWSIIVAVILYFFKYPDTVVLFLMGLLIIGLSSVLFIKTGETILRMVDKHE